MARDIKINGVPVRCNAGMDIKLQDVSSSSSGRTLSAKMEKEIVAQIWSISLNWSFISDDAIGRILEIAKDNTYVQVTFPNPKLRGKDDTRTFYTGDASIKHVVCIRDTNFWNLSLNFIEQ